MDQIKSSRLVCINSRKIPEGSSNKGDDYTVELGKKIIACKGQCINASLQEFTMPKVWTDVNENNNRVRFSFSATERTEGTGSVTSWAAIDYTGSVYIRPANYGSIHDLAASFGAAIGNRIVTECKIAYAAADGTGNPVFDDGSDVDPVLRVNNWRFYGGTGLVAEPIEATSVNPPVTALQNPGLTGIRSGSSGSNLTVADQSDNWAGDTGYIPGSCPQITPHSLTTISGTTDNIISFTIVFNNIKGELVGTSYGPAINTDDLKLWCDPNDGDSAQLLGCDNSISESDNPIYIKRVVVKSTGAGGNTIPDSLAGIQVICKYPAVRFTTPNVYIRSNLVGETLANNAFTQQIPNQYSTPLATFASNKMNDSNIIGICNVNTEILHTRNTDFKFRIDSDEVSKIRIYVTDEQGRPIGRARGSTLKTATTNTTKPFSMTQPAYPNSTGFEPAAPTPPRHDHPNSQFLFPSDWYCGEYPWTSGVDQQVASPPFTGTKGLHQSTLGNLNFQATLRFDIVDKYDDYNKCG